MSEVRVWLRPNGNVVVREVGDPTFFELSQDDRVVSLTGSIDLPADAELLIREADLDAAVASSPLPKPNAENPSHYRFAARMHELADISFAAYQQLMDVADRLEREKKAQAARDALVEEMARAGYEAVDEVLANGDPSRLHHWDSFTQGKEHHRIIARALLDDPRFKIERVEDE